VESAALRLGRSTDHYLYVSSIAAYDARAFARPGLTEDAPLNRWDAPTSAYNRGKAESERRLQQSIGERLTIVRPGAIKGSRDTTPDLLTWLRRAQRGGRHIAPGDGTDHVQFVDVKDVARFLVLAVERSLGGVFNITGASMTFRELVQQCNDVTRSSAAFMWMPRDFLHAQGLDPAPFDSPTIPSYLGKFPSWHPEPERRGLRQVSSDKAFRAGWKQRPFEETAIDYLSWIDSLGPTYEWSDELSADVEAAVISRYLSSAARPSLRR
jgi:2'-hydroxyisoflavone reductase